MKNSNIKLEKDNKIIKVITIIVSILLLVIFATLIDNKIDKMGTKITVHSIKIKDTLAFKDSILNFIFELRLEHPYIVYSQAIIESNNFSSNIWKENNNMFGMKMPERRPTVAISINKGHSVYKNWRDCVIDYALFQSSYLRGLTEEEYFVKIGSSYAEDSSYEKKIREVKNQSKFEIK